MLRATVLGTLAATTIAAALAFIAGDTAARGQPAKGSSVTVRVLRYASHPGERVTLDGHPVRARAAVSVALQVHGVHRWRTVARSKLPPDRWFRLSWRVPRGHGGLLELRVVARSRTRVVALSQTLVDPVAPPPVLCRKPEPVALAPGQGAVVGGLYLEGGPAPGGRWCQSSAYDVTAVDASGKAVATQHVAGGHSYMLALAAGSYRLTATPCGIAAATRVRSGQTTHVDIVCPVP